MIISRKRMLAGATLVVIGGLLALTILPTAQKLYRVVHFFDADNIVENFRSTRRYQCDDRFLEAKALPQ